ncbi:transposase [Maribacter sp. 2307ULW6-5]|uniref:transposase n=1 Tax=Maribacter sp. 2307ULW6-5 TaxID=3386275 RepID=UPI0039BD289D
MNTLIDFNWYTAGVFKRVLVYGLRYRIERSAAFLVIRAKSPLRFKRQYSRPKSGQQDIICNHIGEPVVQGSRQAYPIKLRRIRTKDPETGKAILLLTNHMDMEEQKISLLYRPRWKIEIFFRWIKQHLGIKVFWDENENAVKSQTWVAMALN